MLWPEHRVLMIGAHRFNLLKSTTRFDNICMVAGRYAGRHASDLTQYLTLWSVLVRIEINNDRHRSPRPDPVATAEGVFGVATARELSSQELHRLGRLGDQTDVDLRDDEASYARPDAPRPDAPVWTPGAVMQRLTALYARLSRPKQQSGVWPNPQHETGNTARNE